MADTKEKVGYPFRKWKNFDFMIKNAEIRYKNGLKNKRIL